MTDVAFSDLSCQKRKLYLPCIVLETNFGNLVLKFQQHIWINTCTTNIPKLLKNTILCPTDDEDEYKDILNHEVLLSVLSLWESSPIFVFQDKRMTQLATNIIVPYLRSELNILENDNSTMYSLPEYLLDYIAIFCNDELGTFEQVFTEYVDRYQNFLDVEVPSSLWNF